MPFEWGEPSKPINRQAVRDLSSGRTDAETELLLQIAEARKLKRAEERRNKQCEDGTQDSSPTCLRVSTRREYQKLCHSEWLEEQRKKRKAGSIHSKQTQAKPNKHSHITDIGKAKSENPFGIFADLDEFNKIRTVVKKDSSQDKQ